MDHFEDEICICVMCSKKVLIKHNQVGGFWYLNNSQGVDGNRHSGGHCPDCYDKISGNNQKESE